MWTSHLWTGLRRALGFCLMAIGALMGVPMIFGATLTTEAPSQTWLRLETELLNWSPCAQMQMRAFKSWLMQHLSGINLQCIAIANLTDDVNDLDGALRVYAIILKKQGTATDAYYKLFDDATNSGTAGDERITLPVFEANKEVLLFFPDGLPIADGLVETSHTSSNGTTDSTSGDGPNGFMLVG